MADEIKKEPVLKDQTSIEEQKEVLPKDQPAEESEQPDIKKPVEKTEKKAVKKKTEKVKKEKKPKKSHKEKKKEVSVIREKLMLEPEDAQPSKGGKKILLLVAIFAVLFGAAGVAVQVLELLAAMDIYTIGASGLLFITGILLFIPMKTNVKFGFTIGAFIIYCLGVLAGAGVYFGLSYELIPSTLVAGPFVIPFILGIIYFIKLRGAESISEESREEVSLIDEKLVLEEDKKKKVKTPKKVKPKKYKESKDVAKKLFKHRLKFTRRFFRRLKSKAKGKIDILIKKDYFEAEKRAKTLLGITEKDYQQQILITVPDSFSNQENVKYHLEVQKDGPNKLYFNQAYVTVLFYGKKSLYIYQCNIDHRSGLIGYDRAQEFNYFDVISVETTVKYDNESKPKYSVLNAELTLSNNQKFLIHLRNQRIHDQLPDQPLISEKEQKVLQMLKDRIRASKV